MIINHSNLVNDHAGRFLGSIYFDTVGTHTYTPSEGTRMIVVEVQAGGGAGAGTVATALQWSMGGGGGGGGYGKKQYQVTELNATEEVVVGAGGTGTTGGLGTDGGNSSFKDVVAAGGSHGASILTIGSGQTGAIYGGAGGTCTGGDLCIIAQRAPNYWSNYPYSHQYPCGGASPMSVGSMMGESGRIFGGGGGGRAIGNNAAAQKGPDGAQGIVIIHEYS